MLSLFTAACSNFEQQWRQATMTSRPHQHPVGGAWEGTWKSEATGHAGALRCVVSPLPTPEAKKGEPSELSFTYHARWGFVLRGTFATRQPVVPLRWGEYLSEGHWQLPKWAGGRYHYRIKFSGSDRGLADTMEATYTSAGDYGVFSLRRPASAQIQSEARQPAATR